MTSRRSPVQWQQLIEAQQQSELSQKAFCQQQGVAVATFSYWKRKLSQAPQAFNTAQSTSSPWLALTGLPVDAGGDNAGAGWKIELDLGHGVCLRLKPAD